MAKELVVVGVDGVLWPGSLLKGTLESFENVGWLAQAEAREAARTRKKSTQGVLGAIGRTLTNRPEVSVREITEGVAHRIVSKLDPAMVQRLKNLPESKYRFVAMSSAPDFVLEQAMAKIREKEGIDFEDTLASTFEVAEGTFTGSFRRLEKFKAVKSLLDRTGLREVGVGFINGMNDLPWSDEFCLKTIIINPGPNLSKVRSR